MDKFEKILKEVGSENLYKILHLEKFSETETVKKAYKKLIKKYHPDKNKEKDTRDIFEKVGKAYEILNNVENKKLYDEFLTRKEEKSKRIKTFSDKRRKFVEDLKRRESEAKESKFNSTNNVNKNDTNTNKKQEEDLSHSKYTPKTFDEKSSNLGVKIKWSKNSNLIFTKEVINSYFKSYGTIEEIRIDDIKCLATILFLSEKSVDSLLTNFTNDQTLAKLFKIKKCTNKEVEEKPIVIDTKTLEAIKNMKMMKNVEFMNKQQEKTQKQAEGINNKSANSTQVNYLLKSLEELEEIAFAMLKQKINV